MVCRYDIFVIDITIRWVTITWFSISAVWYFRYWCFDVVFRSRFGGNYHVKLSKYWEYFQHRIFDYMIVLIFEFGHNITILKMAIFDKVDYIDIEPALSRMQCHFFSSTLTGLWSRFIPRFVQSPKVNIFMSNFPT